MDSGSGRADAVVAGGAAGLQGFAEMEQAVGERHVRQRRPNRIGEICGGFDHDGDGGGAGDVESKLILLDAKIAVAGLDQRVP